MSLDIVLPKDHVAILKKSLLRDSPLAWHRDLIQRIHYARRRRDFEYIKELETDMKEEFAYDLKCRLNHYKYIKRTANG